MDFYGGRHFLSTRKIGVMSAYSAVPVVITTSDFTGTEFLTGNLVSTTFRVQRDAAYVTRWLRLRFDSRATCVYRMGVVRSQSRRNCNQDCIGEDLGRQEGTFPSQREGRG